jgi:putative membrane protein
MAETTATQPQPTSGIVRGAFGGVLMGLANLVPGISGGTMLLAAGIYTRFVNAVAEVTTLRFSRRSLAFLFLVCGSALVAILLVAGPVKTLVTERRWIMYSLFIGLTLGGVPLVWRLARPVGAAFCASAVGGLGLMLLLSTLTVGQAVEPGAGLLFVSGAAGAAAMILPGVSGGYLLLVFGSYLPVLGAIDDLKTGLQGDFNVALQAMGTLWPFALGVAASIMGMSNLLRWLLRRHAQTTLGVLLGLLLGAVVGIWPFQRAIGERTEGLPQQLETYAPGAGQAAAAMGLVALGLALTLLIDRLGGAKTDQPPA